MAGNVKEWVADWYDPKYHLDAPTENPLGPENGEERLVKSSSNQDRFDDSLAGHRFHLDPLENLIDLGFRCVVEDPTYFAPFCEAQVFMGPNLDGSQANCVPTVQCNDVDISLSPVCDELNNPIVIVNFDLSNTPPDGWTYDAPLCSQNPGAKTPVSDQFICPPGAPAGPAVAEGTCDISAPAGCDTCPAHYNKVGDACIWDGSGTEGTACLPGFEFDPAAQCCTSSDGVGADYGLCPAGSFPLNGICVANPFAVPDKMIVPIVYGNGCEPPPGDDDNPGDDDGDDDGGACTLPAKSNSECRQELANTQPPPTNPHWDPVACKCVPQ